MGLQAVEETDINLAFVILPSKCKCILNSEMSPVTPIYTTALPTLC